MRASQFSWDSSFWHLLRSKSYLNFRAKNIIINLTHYSKSHILSKNSIATKPQHFHEFFTIFHVKSKLSTAKNPKPQHFHEFLTPKNWQFSWKKMKISNSVISLISLYEQKLILCPSVDIPIPNLFLKAHLQFWIFNGQ